jgi:periplasmic divalent cation tolerance protein
MEASNYCIVSTTTDTKENASIISKTLLEKKLIACAQQTTTQSSYRWQGKIIESDEILLQMKTKKSLFDHIKKEIKSLHTYEVPEIIMIPLLDANTFYLEWIEKETIKV